MTEPALTQEEWRSWITDEISGEVLCFGDNRVDVDRLHTLAALCLHGRDFGFSWEDVDWLLEGDAQHDTENGRVIRSIADRIAALLPPRDDA